MAARIGPMMGTNSARPAITPSAKADGTPTSHSPSPVKAANHEHGENLSLEPAFQSFARVVECGIHIGLNGWGYQLQETVSVEAWRDRQIDPAKHHQQQRSQRPCNGRAPSNDA